jgi:membrane dipeptidase
MEEEGEIVAITDRASLQKHIALWNDGTPNDEKPIGYILSWKVQILLLIFLI